MPKDPGFTISSLEEIAFWYRTPQDGLKEEDALHFSIEHSFNVHTSTRTVEVVTNILFNRNPTESVIKRPPLLNYQVRTRFEVRGLDVTPHPDEDPSYEYIQLPEGLTAALVSTSYSTCRGMLFVRTAGTPLHNYLLPIANPIEMSAAIGDRIRKEVVTSDADATKEATL